jgi:hypothetical protein
MTHETTETDRHQFGTVSPPGLADFIARVAPMNRRQLEQFGSDASARYERLRNVVRLTLAEHGETLAAGTTWDRICAIETLCEFYWLTQGDHLTVAECLSRLSGVASDRTASLTALNG